MEGYNRMKYAAVQGNMIINILDEPADGCIKVPVEVQIGWTYNSEMGLYEPPIPPVGFAYDWQGNCFVPLSDEAAQEQNEFLEKQDLFQRMSAEKFIKESGDILVQELIDRGII